MRVVRLDAETITKQELVKALTSVKEDTKLILGAGVSVIVSYVTQAKIQNELDRWGITVSSCAKQLTVHSWNYNNDVGSGFFMSTVTLYDADSLADELVVMWEMWDA